MSHSYNTYPQPAAAQLPWLVREESEEYDARVPNNLLQLTDKATELLDKAEAIAWLLNGAEACPDGTLGNASWLLANLIHEAGEIQRLQWEIIGRDYEPKKR